MSVRGARAKLHFMSTRSRRFFVAVVAVTALGTVLVLGLSQAPKTDTDPAPTRFTLAQAQKDLAGAPAPLAALHTEGGRLLDTDAGALKARLAALKGTPVVVNKWASWCGPCRAEFPLFQRAGVRFGKQVAFIGLNSGDNTQDATAFLKRFPVPYPSYEDPRERVASALKANTVYPITIFYDASGKQVALHQGGYPTQADLDRAIQRYLLKSA